MGRRSKFLNCAHCGNMVGSVIASGAPISCCGENMAELVPNTVDASREKHLPAVVRDGAGITVCVGDVAHPMEEKHHIDFVYVETEKGGQKKCFKPGDRPAAAFSFADDEPVAVFAYCNLHGLWVREV